ncbi:hypothetical protein [Microcella sp.]|uniref:hypothetical protein n=1 Tax=Microcella sp. TaxID=1913979 RepID=UPI00391908BB
MTNVSESIVAPHRLSGFTRVLVAVYGILALAATGRSFYQIVTKFDEAPLAYVLSAVAAVVYILATVALVAPGRGWFRVAWLAIGFEMVGVVVVGVISIAIPELFPADTVWSQFGRGYGFVPLVLPILGLWALSRAARAGRDGGGVSA